MSSTWKDLTMMLVRKHGLGFLHNPGGGQFVNQEKGINIQVSFYEDKSDYYELLAGLQKLGLEDK